MCRSKNLNFGGIRRLFTKSCNFSQQTKINWQKSCVKQLFTGRDVLAVHANYLFWRQRLLSNSVLQDLSVLHQCGTVQQKSCSAKPMFWDFEACTLFRLSIFRYWSRLSLFSFSDVWSLSCPNSSIFQEHFPLFVFDTGHNRNWFADQASSPWHVQQMLLYCSCLCRSWLANFTFHQHKMIQDS